MEEGEAGAETEREGEIRSRISCFVLLPPPLPPPTPQQQPQFGASASFSGFRSEKGFVYEDCVRRRGGWGITSRARVIICGGNV